MYEKMGGMEGSPGGESDGPQSPPVEGEEGAVAELQKRPALLTWRFYFSENSHTECPGSVTHVRAVFGRV